MSNKQYTDEELLDALYTCENRYDKVTTKCINEESDLPDSSTISNRFGTFSKAKQKADIENVGQIHLTDDEMDRINESISEYQKNIIKGLLMGDAWVEKETGKTARMSVEMSNEDFLLWVREELGEIVSSMGIKSTGDELAEKNESYGYTVNKENYNDMYVLRTRALNYFNTLREWYSSGQKRFPDTLELSSTMLKMWYCCDGSFADDRYPVIYSSDQSDVKNEILSLFDHINVDPSFTDGGGGAIQFPMNDVNRFFEYIGDHPPGFAYKWSERYK